MTPSLASQTDVLIAGAGPVGLLLAAELRRDGVDVLLVAPIPERSFFCKALGVTPRTLQIFDDLGIVHDAINRGIWLRGLSFYQDGVLASEMEIPDELPFGSLSLAQFETERLLESCLHRHGGAVSYGWALSAFEQDTTSLSAQLTGPSGATQRVTSRYLVGCDGAHSQVRRSLGLEFSGERYPQTFLLADLEVHWDLPRGRAYRFTSGAPGQPGSATLVAIPVHSATGRRYRLSSTLATATPDSSPAPGDSAPPTLAQVTALFQPLLPAGASLSSLHWSSTYRISHRIVPAYSRGRVFLAGDSAHIHPPVGGQGMNTGLQDAHNLAWKLTLASRRLASPALLDSYSLERQPVGLDVVENTSRALNEALAHRLPLPGLRETQLLISYRSSSIVCDERPDASTSLLAAGDLAPDAAPLRRLFVQQPFRLHDLLGRGRHVLLAYFSPEDSSGLHAFAGLLAALRATLGQGASGFAIVPSFADAGEAVPLLIDSAGAFAAAYFAQPSTAWLIRPDGYLAWCSASPSLPSLRSALALIAQSPPA